MRAPSPRHAALLLSVALLVPSCSRQSSWATKPDLEESSLRSDVGTARSLPREPGDFFPLAVGNQWVYELKFIDEVEQDGKLVSRTEDTGEYLHSIDCSFDANGQQWFIYRIQLLNPPSVVPYLRALTQDRSGVHGFERLRGTDPCASHLFEGVVSVRDLQYPLRPGSTWISKDDPASGRPAVSHVERHEVIETPAGRFPTVRIRVDQPLALPGETYYEWYGREGLIAVEDRSESGIYQGLRTRHIVTLRLKNLSLAGRFARKAVPAASER